MDREDMPPVAHLPPKQFGCIVRKSHYDGMVAEIARLRELLANAYTVKPLEWNIIDEGYEIHEAKDGDAVYRVWQITTGGVFTAETGKFISTWLTESRAKEWCEQMHHARVTVQLTKVELPTITRNKQ